MQIIADIFNKLPSEFWAVAFGSFISLLGVVLTNRQNLKQLILKFEQDRELRRADREHAMFQEIYLKAAEVIADRLAIIMRFSDLRIPDNEIMIDPDRKGGAIAQAQLVSDGAAREALVAVGAAIGSTYLRLITKRAPLGLLQSRAQYLDRKTNELLGKLQKINDQVSQLTLEGGDQRRALHLKNDFDFNKSELEKTMAEKDAAYEELYDRQMMFLEECFEESLAIIEPSVNATCEMRRVLNLHTNKEEILNLAKSDADAMRSAMQKFLQEAKRIMDESKNLPPW